MICAKTDRSCGLSFAIPEIEFAFRMRVWLKRIVIVAFVNRETNCHPFVRFGVKSVEGCGNNAVLIGCGQCGIIGIELYMKFSISQI